MKLKKIFLKTCLLMATTGLLLINSSCTGAKGDPGPTGATGAQGNANVASGNTTISPGDWVANSGQWAAQFTNSSITSSIVSSGAVMAYISSDNANWTSLPYTTYSISGAIYTESYTYYTGGFTIWDACSVSPFNAPANTLYVKVVVVASSQRKIHKDVNWNDYNDVVAKVGITNIKEVPVQVVKGS